MTQLSKGMLALAYPHFESTKRGSFFSFLRQNVAKTLRI